MILYTIKDQVEIAELFTKGVFYSRPHETDPDDTDWYKTYGYGWVKRKMSIDHYPVWCWPRYPHTYGESLIRSFIIKYESKDQSLFFTRFGAWHELLNNYNTEVKDLKRWDKEIVVNQKRAKQILNKNYNKTHIDYHKYELQVCIPFLKIENVISIKPYKRIKLVTE